MAERLEQSERQYYIGWDVGAWHCAEKGEGSKDAISIFNEKLEPVGQFWEGNLSQDILDSQHAEEPGNYFIEKLFEKCKESCDCLNQSQFCFAIDTPLGWPVAFRKLLTNWNGEKLDGCFNSSVISLDNNKIHNPLLHRKTEMSLGQSLSAVQDQIGSQSTKAMCLISNLKATRISTGVWKLDHPNVTFIETYPAPCMRSFKFLDAMKGVNITLPVASGDIFDAIVCSLVSREYSIPSHKLKLTSPTSVDDEEGWIFAPDDCIDAKFGVSYGRLVELQSPQKPFVALLSQVQMAIVMKAILKQPLQESKKKTRSNISGIPDQITKWLSCPDAAATDFKEATVDSVKSLFKLLNPKTKKEKVPSDEQFANIAQAIKKKAGQ